MLNDSTVADFITEHCTQSLSRAVAAERHPLWKRHCPELTDSDFIRQGLLRVISMVDSGRHFLQTAQDIHQESIPVSSYFNTLKSSRRATMLKAVERQSYQLHCDTLRAQGIDYLSPFPELNDYTVEAADGHFMDHACHTKKSDKGTAYAAGFIYALNLRNGLLNPLCTVTSGTRRHQEIPVLRTQLEKNNKKKPHDQKQLYVYDKAVTDYRWWDQQKAQHNYMISRRKSNAVATHVEAIPFDSENPVNTGIDDYSVYENEQGIRFSLVTYRDPETHKHYQFITTLPATINPGTIAILYYKRWSIEKAFNNSKSNLKETKAWSSDKYALDSQMRFTAMAYNLLRVFEEVTKRSNPELIHPAEEKYTRALEERQQGAKKQGRFVNPLLFQPRIARLSAYTIRATQSAIITGKRYLSFMRKLAAQLIPRDVPLVKH